MRLSRESLLREADATGFRPEVLEKVFLLLDLLEAVNSHPELSGKLALKGGTALNLFLFDVPRLSVDIDFNYICDLDIISNLGAGSNFGSASSGGLSAMQADRPQVEKAIDLTARRLRLLPQTAKKQEHAGRSWIFRYASALGGESNLKVDLVYTLRLPLWPPLRRDSRRVGSRQVQGILTLDDHELAAGKLVALLARRTSRDLFDAHELLLHRALDGNSLALDTNRLRLAFTVYGAMNQQDWRKVKVEDISPATRDLDTYLRPLLRVDGRSSTTLPGWEKRLVEEVREALSVVLPLQKSELTFLDRLLEDGEIEPELLTQDKMLAGVIRNHPALLWKAQNVRQHKPEHKPGR